MTKSIFKLNLVIAMSVLLLTACGSKNQEVKEGTANNTKVEETAVTEAAEEVTITDAHGEVTVKANPKSVVALDNRTFETLSDWGIEVVAVPKEVMPADSPYVLDENVKNIGNHREPNLEIIAAAQPELVIVGQRFADYYEDIKALVPDAAVIDLDINVSEETENQGENLIEGLKNSTTVLGKIFDKNEEAEKLNKEFDESIEAVKKAYNGEDTVMSVVVSGGEIGFSAPKSGRVWGPMYEIFGWVPALELEEGTSDHKGDGVSVEAIAQSNPTWLMVLDRDAAVSSSEQSVSATDVISGAPALQNITALKEGNIIYAPNDTYTNESIQTYLELFENIANSFKK